MVYMNDSRRAAELVRASGLPVGLHLNLTQEFEDEAAPSSVRERQARTTKSSVRTASSRALTSTHRWFPS